MVFIAALPKLGGAIIKGNNATLTAPRTLPQKEAEAGVRLLVAAAVKRGTGLDVVHRLCFD